MRDNYPSSAFLPCDDPRVPGDEVVDFVAIDGTAPTAGPWTVEDHSPYSHWIIDPTGARILAGTWGRPHAANAHLMAAAPELYAALTGLTEFVEAGGTEYRTAAAPARALLQRLKEGR